VTTFYPTEYFASRIGGDQVKVACALPADADPSEWKPTAEAIRTLQQAQVIVVNGAEFEKWMPGVALPTSRICDASSPLAPKFIKFAGTTHSHGAAGQHTHQGTDGHTWMDPNNATVQAEQVLGAMCRRWPEHERLFAERFGTLAADLKALDARFVALSEGVRAISLIATHPAYNYIAARYEWDVGSLDLPPEEPPSEGSLKALAAMVAASKDRPLVLLFESPPHEAIVKALAAMPTVRAVTFSPCEMLDQSERAAGATYLTVMNANLDALAAAVGASTPPAASPSK
jgi:zinc transport system substrate-binding protein